MREAMADAIREIEREEQAMEGKISEDQRMEQAEETGPRPPAVGSADGNEGVRSRAA